MTDRVAAERHTGHTPAGSGRFVPGELELGLGMFLAAAALVAARLYPLWREHFYVACPLLEFTGIPCPTCGGTRALAALAAGQWLEAFAWNPAVAAGGVVAAAFLPVGAVLLWRPEYRPTLPQRVPLPLTATGALLLAANQVYLFMGFRALGG